MSTTTAGIRAFDCVEQHEAIEDEIVEAVRAVLRGGTLILGPQVRQFEEAFAGWLGAPGYGLGVGNGTDALAIALRALGIGPGDEVITVANTAVPTVSAIRMVGACPVFCEIDPRTLLLDVADAAARITPRTRAIVPVHLFGNAVDMPWLVELAERHGLAVIEDCAQSCGTTLDGRHTGTFGDVGCFSFYPTKNLGACGDAGFCFTRDRRLYESMREIRAYGCGSQYDCRREGVNSRLDELQAAILNVKLRHLPEYLARRREVAAVYDRHLASHVARPLAGRGVDHSYHLYVVELDDRGRVVERLRAEEIGYGIHYPTPIHLAAGYQFLGYRPGSLPHTERAARQVLSLPCYPELSHEAARRVSLAVNDATRTQH